MNARILGLALGVAVVAACGSEDGPNRPPVVSGQPVATVEDTAVTAAFTASDPDRDELTFRYSTPLHGALTNSGPMITYTPEANYHGTDTVTATVGDGALQATATITITISPANDPPVADDDSLAGAEDTPTTVPGATLVANDVDLDGDTLTVMSVTAADHGTVVLNGGTVTFTPAADFIGDASFDYVVTDGTATDTGRVAVAVGATNDPPIAFDDTGTTAEDTALVSSAAPLVDNDTDAEGQSLTVTAVGNPQHGTIVLAAGVLTFTPEPNYSGAASFDYTVSDGAATDTGRVAVTVTAVADPPVAVDDARAIDEDLALVIAATTLATNDTDPEGQALTVTAVGAAINGTVALVAGTITFTPLPNLSGAASFQYTVSDGALTDVGQVAIAIAAVPDPPVPGGDLVDVVEDTPTTIAAATLLINDADVDGPSMQVTAVGNPLHGTVALAAGDVTFTPAPDYDGTAQFTYTVSDGTLAAIGGVVVIVAPVNDPPVAVPDLRTTAEDTALIVAAATLTANDTDVDGSFRTVTAVGSPTGGTVALAAGTITFTPAANFAGTAGFEYTVADLPGLTDVGTVAVDVTAVNDLPLAISRTVSVERDLTKTITLTASDVDSPSVTFAAAPPGVGTLGAITPVGPLAATVSYTPPPGFTGPTTFTFTAHDGSASSPPATVMINVIVPVCNDGLVEGSEGCDDQGNAAGDGCSPTCQVEAGWTCSGEPSACEEICGNGALDAGEQCDDDNTVNLDGCSATCRHETLFFSEYLEGSSNNKAIEIFNPFLVPMTVGNCSLRLYSNGAVAPNQTLALTGSIAAHDVLVACHGSINATVAGQCDVTSSTVINWNGDDAIELHCGGVAIDILGRIGEDPTVEWGLGLTSTADNTLRRKCTITAGDPIGSDVFDPAVQWDGFATDTFAGLGSYGCPL